MSAYEHQFNSRMDGSIEDYHVAPGGDGPLASEWKDKPHRLLYDLLGEVQWLRRQLEWQPIETAPTGNHAFLAWEPEYRTMRMVVQYPPGAFEIFPDARPWPMKPTHWMPLPAPPESA